MIKPFTASEQLMFNTIRIISVKKDGTQTTGTGFIFNYLIKDGMYLPFLVTNKHVIDGSIKESLRFHIADASTVDYLPSGLSEDIWFTGAARKWFYHPNPDVDLAAMLYMPFETLYQQQTGKLIYSTKIGMEITLRGPGLAQMSAAVEVLMFGYPAGLSDSVNNLPLMRRGITSIHPEVNYMGKPWGVVDLACFPGSSGSPIFVFREEHFTKLQDPPKMGDALLLGVLFAGPQYDAYGNIEMVEAPTSSVPLAKTSLMMHLGYYIKAEEVITLGDYIRDTLLLEGPISVKGK